MLINRDSLSILVAKKDLEDQEQDKLTGVMVQSTEEAKHLLVSLWWSFFLPRTAVETGKDQCWSGILSHGEVVIEGNQGPEGERNLLP